MPDETRLSLGTVGWGVRLTALFWALVFGFAFSRDIRADPASLVDALLTGPIDVALRPITYPGPAMVALICIGLPASVTMHFALKERYPLLGYAVGGLAAGFIGYALWHLAAMALNVRFPSFDRFDDTWNIVTIGALAGVLAWGIMRAGRQGLSLDSVPPTHRVLALALAFLTATLLYWPAVGLFQIGFLRRPPTIDLITFGLAHYSPGFGVLKLLLFGALPGYFALHVVLKWFRGTFLAAVFVAVICATVGVLFAVASGRSLDNFYRLVTAGFFTIVLPTGMFCGLPAGAAAWCWMWLARRRDGGARQNSIVERRVQYGAACAGAAIPFVLMATPYVLDLARGFDQPIHAVLF